MVLGCNRLNSRKQEPEILGEEKWERENSYKKLMITPPEFFSGVGIRINKKE